MRHPSWQRPWAVIASVAALSALAVVPAVVTGAGSAAAAPAAAYAAHYLKAGTGLTTGVAVNSATNTIYVGDSAGDVIVINASTDATIATLTLPAVVNSIASDSATNTVYAVVGGSAPEVVVIAGADNSVSATIPFPAGVAAEPGIAVDSAADKIYVTDQAVNSGGSVTGGGLFVIDGHTNQVVASFGSGGGSPDGIAVDAVTDVIWVTNFSGAVTAISAANGAIMSTVTIGGEPESVAVNPVTNIVYVSAAGVAGQGAGLNVIDGSAGTLITTLPISNLSGVAFDPGSDVVYASGLTETAVVDGATNAIADTLPNAGGRVVVDSATGAAYEETGSGWYPGLWDITPSATNGVSPTLIAPSSTTFTTGSAGRLPLGVLGLPAPTVTVTGALPAGVSMSPPGVLSGTPASGTGGVYHVTITASNGIAPDFSLAFTLTVDQPPVVIVPSTATFRVGTPVSVPIQVTGYPAVRQVSANGLPAGVSIIQPSQGSWQLSGTPAAGSGGVYQPGIRGYNGLIGPTTVMDITVQEAPAISGASALVETGMGIVDPLAFRGYPAPLFSETGKLPAGVTLSPFGVLSGTPATGSGGVYRIQLTATNTVGTVTQAFTLFVYAPPAFAAAAVNPSGVPYAHAPQLGAGWHSLGGRVSAPPAVAAPPNAYGGSPAKPDFIAPGPNHVLYIRGLTGSWQRLGPRQASCLAAAAVITGRTLTVACEGLNHALYYGSAAVPAKGLPSFTTAWKRLGGTISAGPAVAPVGGVLTFYVRGTNGIIYARTLTTNFARTKWTCLGQPAAALQVATGQTVFSCEGTNQEMYAFSASPPFGLINWTAGPLVAGPAIAATTSAVISVMEFTELDVITQGLDPSGPGGGFTDLGGPFTGGIGAAGLN